MVAYHAVDSVKQKLLNAGFKEIKVVENPLAVIARVYGVGRSETRGRPRANQGGNIILLGTLRLSWPSPSESNGRSVDARISCDGSLY